MSVRALIVFGTRPEAIKMSPVVHECQRRDDIETVVCLTGQHKEMLEQVTDYFGITADEHLNVMSPNQTLATLTARCVERIDATLEKVKPDCILAQGDTTTVMAASLAAFYRKVPLLHVEAGLRTGDLYAPWPEEFNRRVTSIVAAIHCAPTERSKNNLLNESVDPATVHVTGNTVIDALLWTVDRERKNSDAWKKQYSWLKDRMVLVTGHRRENFGGGFRNICAAIKKLATAFPDVDFVYPVHLNPNVQGPVSELLSGLGNVHLLPPKAYPEFVWLMDQATVLLTDSGGVQEEAPSLRKPILVMRDTTERPEAVAAGAVELVGTQTQRIVDAVTLLLTNNTEYERRQIDSNPYGDGQASIRIADLIARQAWT
ncbi:UDP-N-acetylglucosamine 2-epimerase (non-hydrolyzing) [bacterium]|nr:UDP-N-acetylglucosamine 2-epimerase (non-hydrolyzing) [bacterium]